MTRTSTGMSRSLGQTTKQVSAKLKLEVPSMSKPSVQPVSSPPAMSITGPVARAKVPLVKPSSLMDRIPAELMMGASPAAAQPTAAVSLESPSTEAPAAPTMAAVSQAEADSQVSESAPAPENRSRYLSNKRKVLLAAIPGFFGLMGLAQLYQGKRTKGMAFLIAGIAVSFFSSWYLILPSRIDVLLFGGTLSSSYALSFLAPIFGDSAIASRVSLDLIGVVMAVWGLQLFDAMGPIFVNDVAVASTTSLAKAPTPVWPSVMGTTGTRRVAVSRAPHGVGNIVKRHQPN